jgi:SAM-dependent methyltransferase
MTKRVRRLSVHDGYEKWSATYDRTPNPLVALDRRHTMKVLRPRRGERILDAGCGTGSHLGHMVLAESRPVGLDLSHGMLRVARRKAPSVPLAQANLNDPLPVRSRRFKGVLCALVGEHLTNLSLLFHSFFDCLFTGGRLVFSVFHPEMAAAGIEANFEKDGVEYRLGAFRYSVDDYLTLIDEAGFRNLNYEEFCGDERLAKEIPAAAKYLNRLLLLVIEAHKN